MVVIDGEGAVRLSVREAVKEIEAEAECVCVVDTAPEDVGDGEVDMNRCCSARLMRTLTATEWLSC